MSFPAVAPRDASAAATGAHAEVLRLQDRERAERHGSERRRCEQELAKRLRADRLHRAVQSCS